MLGERPAKGHLSLPGLDRSHEFTMLITLDAQNAGESGTEGAHHHRAAAPHQFFLSTPGPAMSVGRASTLSRFPRSFRSSLEVWTQGHKFIGCGPCLLFKSASFFSWTHGHSDMFTCRRIKYPTAKPRCHFYMNSHSFHVTSSSKAAVMAKVLIIAPRDELQSRRGSGASQRSKD